MVCKVYLRRFVALLLCCVLVWCSFVHSSFATDPVTAASLAITGGQLAGAGLSGEAALSLAGPVGAVVGVTLGALGVNAYVSQASQQAGKTRTRFVLDKLVLWGAQAGYTQEQLYSKIAQGIFVAADGAIQLSNEVGSMITQFANWMFSENMVAPSAGSSTPVQDTATIGSASITLSTTWSFVGSNGKELMILNASSPVFVEQYRGQSDSSIAVYAFVADTSFTYSYPTGNPDNSVRYYSTYLTSTNQSGQKLYYSNGNNPGTYNGDWISTVTYPSGYSTFSEYFRTTTGDVVYNPGTSDVSDEVFVGTPESWAENKDVLNPSTEDTPIVLNPDLLNPIIDSLADGQQATMSIIDYLQALQDAWDHALDDVQTAIGTITDTLTGIQEQIAVPQEAVKNPVITNPGVTPDTTPILDPSTVDPGTAVTGLSFDLTQIFPFCIPFDIYAMLATLSATPEAPVYHVHYEGPYNILIDFTVDLSPWDSVAAVLRTVELLAFCIGLAYVTRSMFIRS